MEPARGRRDVAGKFAATLNLADGEPDRPREICNAIFARLALTKAK
jgi:hypothetical protein